MIGQAAGLLVVAANNETEELKLQEF